MNDRVYLKKEIKSDKAFENHPRMVFGIMLVAVSIMIVASIFFLWMIPFPVLLLLWAAVIGVVIYFILKKNEKSNLSKSDAFILRDGILYYIRLGYTLENEVPISGVNAALGGAKFAMDAARASEVNRKEAAIHEARQHEETFSTALTSILNSPMRPIQTAEGNMVMAHSLPENVNTFAVLVNPKKEKEDKDWMWISYDNIYLPNTRSEIKVRNAFDLDMI